MKILVWIEVAKGNIWHIIHIEEQKQIIHELRFGFLRSRRFVLSRWRPTLNELSLFSVYLKFLRELCEMKVYATHEQVDRLLNENKLTVFDLLFRKEYGLYGQTSKHSNLNEKESEELYEILTRPIMKTYLSTNETHFLLAQARP
jgi:hypothetical protein